MTFTEFKETISSENAKISEVVGHEKISNLFFYFDKDLSSGFMDNNLSPKSKDSFDYVLAATDYLEKLDDFKSKCIENLGFYDNNYELSPIIFSLPDIDEEWELMALRYNLADRYSISYIFNYEFYLKNTKTKEMIVLRSFERESHFEKVIKNIRKQLVDKYNCNATLEDAVAIAISACKDLKDKAGEDYIWHSLRLMKQGETVSEKMCGVLLDVVEISNWTFEGLQGQGIPPEVISALRCLNREDEDFDSYIDRISQNSIAVQVKLNDLWDKMDITRYQQLDEEDLLRLNIYLRAYWRLKRFDNR